MIGCADIAIFAHGETLTPYSTMGGLSWDWVGMGGMLWCDADPPVVHCNTISCCV